MTTASALITRAFREGNLIPVGKSPTTDELNEGLDLLNSYMLSVFGINVGDWLQEWPVPPANQQRTASTSREWPLLPGADRPLVPQYNSLIPENSRIIWDGSEQTVYLHDKPQDGAIVAVALGSGAKAANVGTLTVDGNGRLIVGADTATFTKSDFTAVKWFYRADLANWVQIVPLALTDDMIFPVEFDDLWVVAVSVRLAPRYGKALAQGTIARGAEMLQLLQTRYFQSQVQGAGGEQLVPGFESFNSQSRWMR